MPKIGDARAVLQPWSGIRSSNTVLGWSMSRALLGLLFVSTALGCGSPCRDARRCIQDGSCQDPRATFEYLALVACETEDEADCTEEDLAYEFATGDWAHNYTGQCWDPCLNRYEFDDENRGAAWAGARSARTCEAWQKLEREDHELDEVQAEVLASWEASCWQECEDE